MLLHAKLGKIIILSTFGIVWSLASAVDRLQFEHENAAVEDKLGEIMDDSLENVVEFEHSVDEEIKTEFSRRKDPPVKKDLPPIVVIPGIVGSVLEARLNKTTAPHWTCYSRSDWFKIWLSADVLVPFEGDCWVDNLKLDYRPLTQGGAHNSTGVDIRAPHFGTPRGSVDYLDPGDSKWSSLGTYFGYLVDTFINTYGYTAGDNFVAAPYDWRTAPNHDNSFFCHNLKSLLDKTQSTNKNRKITVVAHSMGNMFFYYCVKHVWPRSWVDSMVDGFVSIAAPWGGAPKALKMITSGENWGIPLLRPNQLRVAERTWASTYFLLPNPFLVPRKNKAVVPMVRVDGSRNYTVDQYYDFFQDMAKTDADVVISNGMYMDYAGEHLLGSLEAPKLRTVCVFGVGLDTTTKLHWAKPSKFPDYVPYEDTITGDGTVPEWSSGDVCKSWSGQQSQPVEIIALQKVNHMGTLWNPDVYTAIAQMAGLDPLLLRKKKHG